MQVISMRRTDIFMYDSGFIKALVSACVHVANQWRATAGNILQRIVKVDVASVLFTKAMNTSCKGALNAANAT